jgi:hypothetical protein
MDKNDGRAGEGWPNPTSLYVLSLPSLLTLSVLEPKVGVRAPRGGPKPGAKIAQNGIL